MKLSIAPALYVIVLAAVMSVSPALQAQTHPSDFPDEPDKSMAAAHESFLKGDMKQASDQIGKASANVKKQADEVAKDAKSGVTKAAGELDKLSQSVKAGTVKSADELNKSFAKADHALATAWHKTAAETQNAGKDATGALTRAAAGLDGAAKWSGNKLQQGTQASVDAIRKAGQGVQTGAAAVGNWFKSIGDGISDLGNRL